MMQTLKYIWRNVTRNKIRSFLTILSVGFSLALLTVLYGYTAIQDQWGIEAAKYHRIVVMSSMGFAGELPIANVDRVRGMNGVKAAVPYSWFGGNYEDQQMPFAQFATDPKFAFQVWDELKISPDELQAWQGNRQGCVVDRRLAARRDWKLGDRIRLQGTFYPVDLDLELVGMFDAPLNTDSLWFDWTYLNESLKAKAAPGQDNAGTIFAKTNDASQMALLSKAIDDRFASSENPTRTQSESAFAQMFSEMLGNVKLYILAIGVAVVFSLSLVAATAMAMSIRERTTEIAVLKAIGFSRLRVLWLVLGEAGLIGLIGGIVGLLLGCLCLEALHNISVQLIPFSVVDMIGSWMLSILALAMGIGLVSGMVPAVIASKLSVVNGLRRVI